MFENIRGDIAQYERFGAWWRRLGFWIIAGHRLGAWANRLPSGPARLAALAVSGLVNAPARILKDVHIPATAKIGPGLVILHPHAIFVPAGTEIGPNCQLFHDVTLGLGPIPGLPKLGRDVVLYTGARVLGGVTVGDGVEIGANAVVIRDVSEGTIVATPASRAIPRATVEVVAGPEARARAAAAAAGRGSGSNGR